MKRPQISRIAFLALSVLIGVVGVLLARINQAQGLLVLAAIVAAVALLYFGLDVTVPGGRSVARPALTAEQQKQRNRSIAIAVLLGLLCVLFYAATIARLGPQVMNRPY